MPTTDQILASLHEVDGGDSRPVRLCRSCSTTLELAGAVMTLVNDDGLQAVVGTSSPVVSRLEELQFELGEGPAVEAARSAAPCLHRDLKRGAATRWPAFAPAALAAGVRSVLAMPLQVGSVRLGGLGLYSPAPGRLAQDEAGTASAYAEAAAVVLLELQATSPPGDGLPPELEELVGYRAEVHQATGFVMVRASVTVDEALVLLRARAYAMGRPLPDVARDVLAERLHILGRDGHDE